MMTLMLPVAIHLFAKEIERKKDFAVQPDLKHLRFTVGCKIETAMFRNCDIVAKIRYGQFAYWSDYWVINNKWYFTLINMYCIEFD